MEPSLPDIPVRGPRLRALAAFAAVGVAVATFGVALGTVRAAPGGDVVDAQRSRVRSLEAEVLRIDAEATAAANARAQAEARAADLRTRIADTNDAIAQTERERAAALARLAERLREIYAERSPTFVDILFSSGSLSDAIEAQQSLDQISRTDSAVVTSLKRSRAQLGELRAELVSGQDEVDQEVAASRSRFAQLQGLIGDRRAALAGARDRLGSLQRQAAVTADRATERALLRRAQPVPAPSGQAAAPATPAPSAPATPSAPAATPAPAAPAAPVTPAPTGPAPSGDVASALARIAQCESGGDPHAVSPSGIYRGKYQFDQGTWEALGGTGDPAAAPAAEQDRIAALLYARSGPAPWPVCGYR